MKYIEKDDNLFKLLQTDIHIISARILGFNIRLKDFALIIEVGFQLLYNEERYLKLIFSGIKEYAFNYSRDVTFYNVENYKLFKQESCFYISFDPYEDDLSKMSDRDNDMILCEGIEGYFYD